MEQKKRNNLVFIIIAAVVFYFLFFNNTNELIGEWEGEDGRVVTFTADKVNYDGWLMPLDYTISGDTITIIFEDNKESGKFKIVDGVLYIYEIDDHYTDGDSYTRISD